MIVESHVVTAASDEEIMARGYAVAMARIEEKNARLAGAEPKAERERRERGRRWVASIVVDCARMVEDVAWTMRRSNDG